MQHWVAVAVAVAVCERAEGRRGRGWSWEHAREEAGLGEDSSRAGAQGAWTRQSHSVRSEALCLHAGSSFLIFIKIHLSGFSLMLCQVLHKQTWSLPLRNFQPKTHILTFCLSCFKY